MEKLGIEIVPLIMQMLNFLLLLGVLTTILYKPLLRMLDERKRRIAKSLEDAEKISRELEEIEKKRLQIVKDATLKAQRIIDEAGKAAKTEAAEILEAQTRKIHQEKEKALGELESYKAKLIADAKKEVLHLAILANEKVLEGSKLSNAQQHELIKNSLKNLQRGIHE